MTRSQSISTTVLPIAALVLGIAIGWRLGPEPAFQSGQAPDSSGRVTLAGTADGQFGSDPQSGSPAEIGSFPDGVASLGDGAAVESGEDAIQYFPDAVFGEATTASAGESLPTPPPARSEGQKSVEPFDEDVWRAELTGLTDEQADELVAIRKRLGHVAAANSGTGLETFPSLANEFSASGADGSQPRLLALPDDDRMRPAIELAAGQVAELSPLFDASQEAAAATISDGLAASIQSEDASGVRDAEESAVARFRDAVETNLRLNLRNQKTPGYRRSEVVVVGVEETSKSDSSAQSADDVQPRDTPDGLTAVSYSEAAWLTRLDARPGEQLVTGNPFDVAIVGPGWLMVEQEGRRCVTRSGLLCRTKDGLLGLKTPEGPLPLVPEIRLPDAPTGWLSIAEDGKVTIPSPADDSSDERPVAGRVVPVCFPNESALERLPSGLLVETAESGRAFECTSVELHQGYLELSTVDPARERAAADELLRFADQLESNH